MKELVKKQQIRVEAFQDFYKNVKSYKTFDSDAHLEEFTERKEQEEAYKKSAVEKNEELFRKSVPRISQINEANG